jgi:acyl carrier protein
MTQTARSLLAEALNCPPDALPDTPDVDNTERWDSLAHVRVILALEAAIGRPLAPREIGGLRSAADIDALLAGTGP